MPDHYENIKDAAGKEVQQCKYCEFVAQERVQMLHHHEVGRKERCQGRDWSAEDAERQGRTAKRTKGDADPSDATRNMRELTEQKLLAVQGISADRALEVGLGKIPDTTREKAALEAMKTAPKTVMMEDIKEIMYMKMMAKMTGAELSEEEKQAVRTAPKTDMMETMKEILALKMMGKMMGGDDDNAASRYTEDRINRLEQQHKEEITRIAAANKEQLERIEKLIEKDKAKDEKEAFEDKLANIIGTAINTQNEQIEEHQAQTAQQQAQLNAAISELAAKVAVNAGRPLEPAATQKDIFEQLDDRLNEIDRHKGIAIRIGKHFGLTEAQATAKAETTMDMVKKGVIDKLGNDLSALVPGFKDVVAAGVAGTPPPPTLPLPPPQAGPVPQAPPVAAPAPVATPLAQITELTMNQAGGLVVPPKYLDAVKVFAAQNAIPFEDYSTHIVFMPSEIPKIQPFIDSLPE